MKLNPISLLLLVYFREFILFLILVVVIIFLLIEKLSLSIPLILLLLVVGIIILNLIGRRRIKELDEIKNIILQLDKTNINHLMKLFYRKHLSALENEIKKCLKKQKMILNILNDCKR
jgi:hypothetical protein